MDNIKKYSDWQKSKTYKNSNSTKSEIETLKSILNDTNENRAFIKLKNFLNNLDENNIAYSDVATAKDSWNGYKGEWQEYIEEAIKKLEKIII
jgi:hypothetical protein